MKYIIWGIGGVLIVVALLSHKTAYSVVPIVSPISRTIEARQAIFWSNNPILAYAWGLADKYGTRPPWPGQTFRKGEIPPIALIPIIIAHLIPCENLGRLIHPGTVSKIVDSNNFYSYGLLMIQSSTWNGWTKAMGITGDPKNDNTAILVASWAIGHGQLYQWTCSRILGIIKK